MVNLYKAVVRPADEADGGTRRVDTLAQDLSEGLRARRRRELMGAISDAALTLIANRGYGGVSLQEIADAAGISLRTLFRHYPNKDAIFGSHIERRERQILERFRSRSADEPLIESYLYAIDAMIDDFVADPMEAEREFGVLREVPRLRAQYLVPSPEHETDAMDEAFAARLGCPPADARLLLLRCCLVNAVIQASSAWRRAGCGGDLRAEMGSLIALFAPMIERIKENGMVVSS